MAQPTPYDPNADYSADVSPGDLGNALDADFTDIQTTTDEILTNLTLIQRDDGDLANGIVGPDQLSAEVFALLGDWTPRGEWVSPRDYAELDFVVKDGIGYLALIAHTSGVFVNDVAAGKWTSISKVDSLASTYTLFMMDHDTGAAWLTDLGVSPAAQNVVSQVTVTAMRQELDVPSTTEVTAEITASAVLNTLADAKGDLLLASANNTWVRKGSPSDGQILTARLADTGGWTFQPLNRASSAPNPFFQIDQRVNSATSRADSTYCLDRWYTLTQSNPIAVSQQADQEAGQPTNIRLSQSNAVAQRMGIATVLEGKDSKGWRGKTAIFVPRIRYSLNAPVRYALLEWTGTEDTVSRDVVLNWASSTYTPNNFFLAANLNVISCGTITPAAATWTDVDAVVGAFGAGLTNVILFVWTEGTAAQNATLDVGEVRFVEGSYVPPHGSIIVPNFADELARCQRYWWKTFNYNVAPVSADQYDGAIKYAVRVAAAVTHAENVRFPVPMRANPAISFVSPATAGASGKWRNFTDTADSGSASQFGVAGMNGMTVTNPQVAGDGVGEQVAIHIIADAEL